MEPVLYTVKRIDGDYAVLIDEKGEENRVAMALLPMEIDEGSRLLCEYFAYTLVEMCIRDRRTDVFGCICEKARRESGLYPRGRCGAPPV